MRHRTSSIRFWGTRGSVPSPGRSKTRYGGNTSCVEIALPNLSILKNNKARAIRFSTLEAICRALECQPGDLLEYLPEE